MNITQFIQTTGAIGALIMIQLGCFWIKQLARDAARTSYTDS